MIDCDFFLLLRVDSSGDFDFPQLENSLQVNPFPPHPAFFLFFIINVMLFPHFAGNHIPIPLSPTMNDICSKSLRSLRCRLEMGKTSTNSNSTTGLIKKKHHHSFRPQSDKLRERRATQQSRDCNLAIILISTVVMFFLCHLPRVVTRFIIAIYAPVSKTIAAFTRQLTSIPYSTAESEVSLDFYFS